MQSLDAADLRPNIQTRVERSKYCTKYLQEFDRKFRDWVELAEILVEAERDKLYIEAGFKTWDAWLITSAPASNRLCYLVKGRFENLSRDFSLEEMKAMPPETAEFARRQMTPALRKDPKARGILTKKRKAAVQELQKEFPEQHFEGIDNRRLAFTDTQADVFDEAHRAYRAMNNHQASVEEFVEYICANWLDSPFEADGVLYISNRQRAQNLEGLNP